MKRRDIITAIWIVICCVFTCGLNILKTHHSTLSIIGGIILFVIYWFGVFYLIPKFYHDAIPPMPPQPRQLSDDEEMSCGHLRKCMQWYHTHSRSEKRVEYPLGLCSVCPPTDPRRDISPCLACRAVEDARRQNLEICNKVMDRFETWATEYEKQNKPTAFKACLITLDALKEVHHNIKKLPIGELKSVEPKC